MSSTPSGVETLRIARSLSGARKSQWLQRGGLIAMAVVVLAGAVGLLGVRQETTTATAGGYTVSFTYAGIARAGWDVPWRLEVTHPGGFDGPVTFAINADAFGIFESQRFFPEPSAETRDGERLYLTFDEPRGDTLVVDYDAYVQPSAQRGVQTRVTVLTEGMPRVSLQASTTLLP